MAAAIIAGYLKLSRQIVCCVLSMYHTHRLPASSTPSPTSVRADSSTSSLHRYWSNEIVTGPGFFLFGDFTAAGRRF